MPIQNWDSLAQQIDATNGVAASATTLINNFDATLAEIQAKLDAMTADTSSVDTFIAAKRDELKQNTDALAAAVASRDSSGNPVT